MYINIFSTQSFLDCVLCHLLLSLNVGFVRFFLFPLKSLVGRSPVKPFNYLNETSVVQIKCKGENKSEEKLFKISRIIIYFYYKWP